ncbi:unnamed protein product [Urochloa humidicola]
MPHHSDPVSPPPLSPPPPPYPLRRRSDPGGSSPPGSLSRVRSGESRLLRASTFAPSSQLRVRCCRLGRRACAVNPREPAVDPACRARSLARRFELLRRGDSSLVGFSPCPPSSPDAAIPPSPVRALVRPMWERGLFGVEEWIGSMGTISFSSAHRKGIS